MNRHKTVAIGCDGWAYVVKQGRVVRDLLEELGLEVHFYTLHNKREVAAFLACQHIETDYVVLCCHDQGATEEEARIVFRCTSAESWHFNSGDDERLNSQKENCSSLVLTPTNIAEYVKNGHGTLINVACGAGRESFAQAFLNAGYEAYIAPEDSESSVSGAYWFLTGFFHYILAERWGGEKCSGREATLKASVNELTYRYYSRSESDM